MRGTLALDSVGAGQTNPEFAQHKARINPSTSIMELGSGLLSGHVSDHISMFSFVGLFWVPFLQCFLTPYNFKSRLPNAFYCGARKRDSGQVVMLVYGGGFDDMDLASFWSVLNC